jgi:hypothetical protein
MDSVKEDSYQILNWRNWEVKAQDRDEWVRESRRPRPALGCSAIDDDDDDDDYDNDYVCKAVPLYAMEALGGRGGIAPTHS